jgi:uncharacterized protein YdaU (DUF1376 family)
MTPETPKRRAPAFPLYADDFLAGTSDMSAEEVGGYVRLLCHQWSKGGLPNDEERLGRMAGLIGSPCLRYVIAKLTLYEDGLLRHPRLERIRAENEAWKAKQAESGAKGAKSRWGNGKPSAAPNDDPNGKPMPTPLTTPMANECLPSPSPSPKEKEPQGASTLSLSIEDQAHPFHVAFGLVLPESLQTTLCLGAVQTWLQYKQERRQSYKPTGLRATLTKWANEFTSATLPSAIENSMACNYSGVFPPNQPQKPFRQSKADLAAMSEEERVKAIMREAMR